MRCFVRAQTPRRSVRRLPESAEVGVALADWALGQREGQPVFIDVPLDNYVAIQWVRESGLEEQRRFTRMVRGQLVEEDTALLWASSGPEKG